MLFRSLELPAGITVQSAIPGLASQAAGKSIQGNPVSGGYRVIVFGLNQDVIPSGPVAVLRLQVEGSAPTGKRVLGLTQLSASNPLGLPVQLTGRNGSVTVR